MINVYCWIHGTSTIPAHASDAKTAKVPHPGIGPDGIGEETYHTYYQWVPMAFALSAVLFYVPRLLTENAILNQDVVLQDLIRFLWKSCEKKFMAHVCAGMSQNPVSHKKVRKSHALHRI